MMKANRFVSVVFMVALGSSVVASSAFSADYKIDPAHTHVGFGVRHILTKVNGEFKDFDGTISFDAKKPQTSKATFVIKAASISTDNPKRDAHLKSPDFFDVAKYPELRFVSKKVVPHGKNHFKLEGDLTIHGVTKPATFEVDYNGSAKDPWGHTTVGFSATTKINRKDFGLLWNKTLETGGVLVGDDVTISIDLEADQI